MRRPLRVCGERGTRPVIVPYLLPLMLAASSALAQQAPASPDSIQQKVERLAAAVTDEQTQIEHSRQQILALRQQVADLQARLANKEKAEAVQPHESETDAPASRLATEVTVLREQQEVQQGEIATHEQSKVESESKYPVKLTGLVLMNAFANTGGVDVIQSPAFAVTGAATTGISLRQSVFGLDARGPRLFGAATRGDVRVDFFGGLSPGSYSAGPGLLRLRTAHATADWERTQAFVRLDRPILNPNAPTSLTGIAQPALAWSGNLWNWLPQVGVAHRLELGETSSITVQAALLDVPDSSAPDATALPASLAERSRWPGSQARLAYARGDKDTGLQLGAGGYFSPHAAGGVHFDAWAATLDYRFPVTSRLAFTGSFYRGLALGGLGGGAYKDYVYTSASTYPFVRPLDDIGGWTQLKVRASSRLEFNAAYGLDNVFAHEIRPFITSDSEFYQELTRNATLFTNVIYSPTAYTLFSFEYRKLDSSPATGPRSAADVFGVAAGYKF